MKGLGERLRAARRAAGYTQVEAAEVLHVHVSTITFYEKDRHEPNLDTLYKLADLYATSVAEILRPINPSVEPVLDQIHDAARLLGMARDTDTILDLMDRLKMNVLALLKEKRERFAAATPDDDE